MSAHHPPRWSSSDWVAALGSFVFLVYALNFLMFFVDDEAIPFVFAQNLLHGRGLAYNASDGVVEGYSDFLHIWLDSLILAGVRFAGAGKLSVFFVGKAWSLAAGVTTVWLTAKTMRELDLHRLARIGAVLFLALAGPVALWACSSLETSTVALLECLLVAALIRGMIGRTADRLALVATTALLLERIDGFVYAGAALAGFLAASTSTRRRVILGNIVLPAAVVALVYHAWRVWYFGELLPMPLYAKVMYKLTPHARFIAKAPQHNYVIAFFSLYAWALPLGLAAGWMRWGRARWSTAVLLTVAFLCLYLAIVGDWMFGYRFFVPLLPLVALLGGATLTSLLDRSRLWGTLAVAAGVIWSGAVAYRFVRLYDAEPFWTSWITHATIESRSFFAPYSSLLEEARAYIQPGDRTAYNQAGFLPFMLDLDNIDDLGVCSKFFAKLPTSDVIFTEVGRFSALTNSESIRASDAYLLYREPRFLITRASNIRNANGRIVPAELLAGRYRLLFGDSAGQNFVYRRTSRPVTAFQTEPRRFLENVAHISHLSRVTINGVPAPPDAYYRPLRFLYEKTIRFRIPQTYVVDVTFSPDDVDVYELHANEIWTTTSATALMVLSSITGGEVHREGLELTARSSRALHVYLPHAVRANRLTLVISRGSGEPADARLSDVRVQGQTPALQAYIRQQLVFPAPVERR